jgi:hypothetical protein
MTSQPRREPSPWCILAIVAIAAIGVLVVAFLSLSAGVM